MFSVHQLRVSLPILSLVLMFVNGNDHYKTSRNILECLRDCSVVDSCIYVRIFKATDSYEEICQADVLDNRHQAGASENCHFRLLKVSVIGVRSHVSSSYWTLGVAEAGAQRPGNEESCAGAPVDLARLPTAQGKRTLFSFWWNSDKYMHYTRERKHEALTRLAGVDAETELLSNAGSMKLDTKRKGTLKLERTKKLKYTTKRTAEGTMPWSREEATSRNSLLHSGSISTVESRYSTPTPRQPKEECTLKLGGTGEFRTIQVAINKTRICPTKDGHVQITKWHLFSVDTRTKTIYAYDVRSQRKTKLLQLLQTAVDVFIHTRSCRMYVGFWYDIVNGYIVKQIQFDGGTGKINKNRIIISKKLKLFIDWDRNENIYYISKDGILNVITSETSRAKTLANLGSYSTTDCFAGHSPSNTIMYCTKHALPDRPRMYTYTVVLRKYAASHVQRPCPVLTIEDPSLRTTFVTATRIALLFSNHTLVFHEIGAGRFKLVNTCDATFKYAHVSLWENEIYMICISDAKTIIQIFSVMGKLIGRSDSPPNIFPFVSD